MDAERDVSGELTPAETKQLLAVRVVYATLTGVAVLTVPPVGAAMTGVMPGFDVIATHAIKKLGARRLDHAAETVVDAADAAETPLAEFIDKAVSDDRRHELFARTLAIAQDTALREKRRALGRALANGVMNDEATIDMELLFISAIADLDETHIRVLARIPVVPPPDQRPSGITPSRLLQEDPGVGEGVYALLGALEMHGLILRHMGGVAAVGGAVHLGEPFFTITQLGQGLLQRLVNDDSTEPGGTTLPAADSSPESRGLGPGVSAECGPGNTGLSG